LLNVSVENGFIKADFKFKGVANAANYVKTAMSQAKEATVIIMDFASRYIISPDNIEQNKINTQNL